MNVVSAGDRDALAGAFEAGWNAPAHLAADVAAILGDVAKRGDAAVLEYARRFDDAAFEITKLRVAVPPLEKIRASIPAEIAAALELQKERLTRFHQRQRAHDVAFVEEDGSRYSLVRRPLGSVAVYVARFGAITSLLMGAVPAKLAGVTRVVALCAPPPSGFDAAFLFACALCGIDELYAVGGAQAVAAAAMGTATLARVDKIVGRGGRWTTEAKRQVFGRCGVDVLAGVSEVLVVADESANSEYIVGELLSAAELPNAARLAVISESRPLLEAVAQLIDSLNVQALDRSEDVSKAIATNCRLVEASSREELFTFINRFAPAYLSLQVRDAWSYLERIACVGNVYIGESTPLVSGEYLAGTNCIAPTNGTARFASGLSLADFSRTFSVVESSGKRASDDAVALAALADFEGPPHHAASARMRLQH